MRIVRPFAHTALVAAALSACAAVPDEIDTGVSIPLTTTTASGATYRLTNATFNFTGPESRSVASSGDEAALEVALSPGSYQLELAGGWRMERITSGAVQPVDAVLVSQPVQQIAVQPGSVTQAYYQFLLATSDSGSVSISFGVTEAATLSGTMNVSLPGCDPATGCAGAVVVAQFAFPPLAPQQVTTDARELWLLGSGVAATFFSDTAAGAGDQLAGAAIRMQLRSGGNLPTGGPQQLSIAIGNPVDGTQAGIAIGPTTVENGVDAAGFPLAPTELTFEAPFVARFLDANRLPIDLQGTTSLTYRAPGTCSPDGTGCGTP